MTPETPAHFQSMQLPAVPDHLAPDGSAIRSLLRVRGGSLAYCTLPAGAISHAVVHQTVEEIWYCLAGSGQAWRRGPVEAEITRLARKAQQLQRWVMRASVASASIGLAMAYVRSGMPQTT